MEVPLNAGNQDPESRITYRSVKPPDQCVISYNFEHANTINFTHNLLIGMGLNEPSRKSNPSAASPNKQKLFSIIPQPKKVFRNEASSVNKAYNAAILPKRYIPEKAKPHNSSTHSQYASTEGHGITNDLRIDQRERENHIQLDKLGRGEEGRYLGEQSNTNSAEPNSPYGIVGKKKTDKSRLSKNQNTKEGNSSIYNHKNRSSIIHEGENHLEDDQDQTAEIRKKVSNQDSLIKEGNNQRESEEEQDQNRQFKDKQHHKGYKKAQKQRQNFNGHQQANQSLNQNSNQQEEGDPNNNISIQNPAKKSSSYHQSKPKQFGQSTKKRNNPQNHQIKQNKMAHDGSYETNQEEGKVKSKKQIQDQQLDELQAKVRREEASKFKKGYFRASANKEKEVLPFQASIEPLFTSNKQSFSQHPNNNQQRTTLNSTNSRGSLAFPSTLNKKPHELTDKPKGPINNLTKVNSTANLRPVNLDPTQKSSQRQVIKRQSNFAQPTQSKHQLKQKENRKNNLSVNRPSNNITSLPDTHKIKRNDQNSKPKTFKTETGDKYKPIKNQVTQDLTANNQIKGFKIPDKSSSFRMPKLTKGQSNSEINARINGFEGQQIAKAEKELKKNEGKQIQSNSSQSSSNLNAPKQNFKSFKQTDNNPKVNDKEDKKLAKSPIEQNQRYSEMESTSKDKINNKNESQNAKGSTLSRGNGAQSSGRANKSAFVGSESNRSPSTTKEKQRDSRLKPTESRQSKQKDRRFKKWRDSQLEEVQIQRRQSKRKQRDQSNASKQRQNKRVSRLKSKPSKEIDIDAQEQDKFGLLSKKKKTIKSKPPKNSTKRHKGTSIFGPQEPRDPNEQLSEEAQSNQQHQDEVQQESHQESSQQSLKQNDQKQQEILMDDNLERISSIHSSKISEHEGQFKQKMTQNRKSVPPGQQNLQQLLKATEETPSPNKMSMIPVDIELENSNIQQNQMSPNKDQNPKIEQKSQQHQLLPKQDEKKSSLGLIITDTPERKNALLISQNSQELPTQQNYLTNNNQPTNDQVIQTKKNDHIQTKKKPITQNLIKQSPKKEIEAQPNPNQQDINVPNKQQDFFEYNIKEMSKFNETVNQTFNMTKYETFERDLSQYPRAPILSFIYGNTTEQFGSFIPSTNKINLLDENNMLDSIGDQTIDQAINILLSIDHWIIQRIFQPYLNAQGQIGVWLHWQGHWRVLKVIGDNYRIAIKNAIEKIKKNQSISQIQLEDILRLISGVRVAKLKSNKKRVLNQLDYSLNKKHILKAVTSKQSKWGQRMFQVVKVQISKQGNNILKLKQRSQFIWVKQQKFQQIFQHFLLICTRPSHFWINQLIPNKQSHKSVIKISSDQVVHGSVTLFYPSKERSSLCLYKELDSKVLKFMGKIEEKANQNGNLYFQFRMHGAYYLFLETPADCDLAIQSTSKLSIDKPEYIISQTLKNDKCEYVEIERAKNSKRPESKQIETLEKLRQKFINMVTIK